jgi:hypothetical protein
VVVVPAGSREVSFDAFHVRALRAPVGVKVTRADKPLNSGNGCGRACGTSLTRKRSESNPLAPHGALQVHGP